MSNDSVTKCWLLVKRRTFCLPVEFTFCLLVLQVQKADGKLDMIAWQIDEFEKAFEDPEDEVGVRFSAFISLVEITRSHIELCSF